MQSQDTILAKDSITRYIPVVKQPIKPTQITHPNTCKYCHRQTNRTYRDTSQHNLDNNLIACCPQCADQHEALIISSIFKQAE